MLWNYREVLEEEEEEDDEEEEEEEELEINRIREA